MSFAAALFLPADCGRLPQSYYGVQQEQDSPRLLLQLQLG